MNAEKSENSEHSEHSESRLEVLAHNFKNIKSDLGKARLVAVTKYSPLEDLFLAYEIGQRDFGENRVKDLELKAQAFFEKGFHDVRWHFIGNLQSNKLNQLLKIKNLYSIHSIDTLKLLKKLYEKNHQLSKGKELSFFLQIKTSDEEEKSGFGSLDDVYEALRFIEEREKEKTSPSFLGFMTMGKVRTENFEQDAAQSFESLVKLRDSVLNDFHFKDLKLSMGMSKDYKIALAHGSDFVRVGSALFSS